MDPTQDPGLYKYFEPRDCFVRIRLSPRGGSPDGVTHELDGEGYRRAVVASFVDDLPEGEDLERDEEALEALYRLVVDVNPELDIHAVSLRDVRPARRAATPRRRTRREVQTRLRRIAGDVEERLAARVLGQPEAVHCVGEAVRRAALGWRRRGPLATLLFVGPTGTGKTELARALAVEIGGEASLVRVDCSEFAEGHEYAKLIGAPPGYVGHAEGGTLSRAFLSNPDAEGRRPPRAVLLFDEFEKAHPRLHHLLLQILDEGHVTDGQGERLDFRDTFVVLTSNTGTRQLQEADESIGFVRDRPQRPAQAKIVQHALTRAFRPELLARLEEIVLFRDIDPRQARRIAELRLTELAARVRRTGPRVRFTRAVQRWVAERGTSIRSGARGIEHVIRREIESPLAEALLSSGGGRGGWLEVSIRNGRPRVERAA